MNLFEVKDVVRDFVGRDNIKPSLMNFAIGSGLREIEKRINAWWMRRNTTFNATDKMSSPARVGRNPLGVLSNSRAPRDCSRASTRRATVV